jgi:hypothetical protein
VDSSLGWVRGLCWALVALAIAAALLTLIFATGILFPRIEIENLVDRLVAIRAQDGRNFPLTVLGSLASIGVFLASALLGVAIRPWAPATPLRDALTVLFVIGGVIGIAANLLNIAVAQAATFGYCDCGFKAEEVISQDYALGVGWTIVSWLSVGAVTLVGAGAALAGRLVAISPAWKTLSYLIAAVLVFGVALRVLSAFLSVQGVDLFQISDLVVAVGAGILVPIWAVMLARGATDSRPL